MTDKVIKAVKITDRSEVRLTTGFYEGKEWFSFRIWSWIEGRKVWVPTPRGLTLEKKVGEKFFSDLTKNTDLDDN